MAVSINSSIVSVGAVEASVEAEREDDSAIDEVAAVTSGASSVERLALFMEAMETEDTAERGEPDEVEDEGSDNPNLIYLFVWFCFLYFYLY